MIPQYLTGVLIHAGDLPLHEGGQVRAGEPAKHPDTERLDWLFSAGHLAEFEDRAAIDAARKEVQP